MSGYSAYCVAGRTCRTSLHDSKNMSDLEDDWLDDDFEETEEEEEEEEFPESCDKCSHSIENAEENGVWYECELCEGGCNKGEMLEGCPLLVKGGTK